MKPKIIKTEKEHGAALRCTSRPSWTRSRAHRQEGELELWALLIDQYEEEHHPIEAPDPIEAIKFRMEQMGLTQKDLVESLFPQKARSLR